jgi:hypothetical protein
MSCERESNPIDAHRAIRQLERFLGLPSFIPEHLPRAPSSTNAEPDPGETLIATMTYYPDEGRTEIKRVLEEPHDNSEPSQKRFRIYLQLKKR